MITASQVCRHFTYALATKFGPIEFSPEKAPCPNQCHVDFLATPYEMNSITHLEQRVDEAATKLAEHLKERGANVCYRLELPEHAKGTIHESAVWRFEGMSVRCLLHKPRFYPGVDEAASGKWLLRWDVLYRTHGSPPPQYCGIISNLDISRNGTAKDWRKAQGNA